MKVKLSEGSPFLQVLFRSKTKIMDDLVEVGHKKAGLICIERSVYVAFQFAGVERTKIRKMDCYSDRLVDVDLFRSVCLDLP